MTKIFDGGNGGSSYKIGVNYIKVKKEFIVSLINEYNVINFIRFTQSYKVRESNSDNKKCYSSFSVNNNCDSTKTPNLIYDKNSEDYIVLRLCGNEINYVNISDYELCNEVIGFDGLDFDDIDPTTTETTIIKTTIPTTFIDKKTTLIKTSLIKTTIPTTLISTSVKKMSTLIKTTLIQTTIPTTLITTTTKKMSTLIKTSTIKTTIPTTLISTSVNKMSTLIKTSTVKTTIPNTPTTVLDTNNERSTLIKSSSSILTSSSSIYSKPPSTESSLISPSTLLESQENNLVYFYNYGEVIKGNINKTKDELENLLDDLMLEIEIGKKYEIKGTDYNITITPINSADSFKSANIDFSLCEQRLRDKYKIKPNETLTFLQIEIDKKHEKALTNQIEYAVYNGTKVRLDLSVCKDVEIKITYNITDTSLLNISMIDYYSKLGIDIFDREDAFFNDLCYPFSISDSDIILKDRVSDIYQNVSLCDNGCEYEQLDVDNLTVTCSCQIKEQVNTEVSKPVFTDVFIDTFKDSNFGVIRCYELVFDFGIKLHNIGFLVFFVLVIFHAICYIYYFVTGIKSITIFVYKEMSKNNYLTRFFYPPNKKKKNSRNRIIKMEDVSNSINDFNSKMLINNESKRKTLKKLKDFKDIIDSKKKLISAENRNSIRFNKKNDVAKKK